MRTLLLSTAACLVLGTGHALAHAQLAQAAPRVGATVRHMPVIISLTFTEVPRLPGSAIMLIGPDGRKTLLEPLAHDPGDPMTLLAPTPRGLGPGRYGVHWGALSPDAHRTQGDFAFTVSP